MQVRYRFLANVDYFRAVINRHYRQGPWLLRLPVQFSIIGAVAAYVVAKAQNSMAIRATLFIVIFGAVVALGVWATKQGIMMKFRSRPGFGSEVTITLSDGGFAFGSDSDKPTLEWSAYPSAVRFSDGILLKRRAGSIRWLPDSALIAGDAAAATDLVSSNTSLRHVI